MVNNYNLYNILQSMKGRKLYPIKKKKNSFYKLTF